MTREERIAEIAREADALGTSAPYDIRALLDALAEAKAHVHTLITEWLSNNYAEVMDKKVAAAQAWLDKQEG